MRAASIAAYVVCALAGLAVTLNTIGVPWGPPVASGITAAIAAWTGISGVTLGKMAGIQARQRERAADGRPVDR